MLMQKISQKGVAKSIIQEVLQEFDMMEVAERTAEKLLKKYQGVSYLNVLYKIRLFKA